MQLQRVCHDTPPAKETAVDKFPPPITEIAAPRSGGILAPNVDAMASAPQ